MHQPRDGRDAKPYETPRVVASLDALGMISDADGLGVGVQGCGSHCPTIVAK